MNKRIFTSSKIILLSFLFVILPGSLLLMLPVSSGTGRWTSFTDALFTAVSAVCVTGLVVQDTATYWSHFGQSVIIGLIQIGGMGVITLAIMMFVVSGRKIGLMQRRTMQDAIGAPQMGGIVFFTLFIIKIVLAVELAGALLLALVFVPQYGLAKGIWFSVFHSISAFCNAGFDLMGEVERFSSLTGYSGNLLLNVTIMLLIIMGGIGFLTMEDLMKHGFHLKRYRLQSKIILTMTVCLILLPALYFFFFEFAAYGIKDRILMSLFQSVTTRTAGFNTADLSKLHDNGKLLMILLMLTGGSPGSTAGGMKTTTMAVLLLGTIAVFRRQSNIVSFRRRIADDVLRNAIAILLMYFFLCISFACVISYLENLPLLDVMFEAASAIGTVGLTLGITQSLGTVSRLLLILLMFLGRVGGLTFVYAVAFDSHQAGKQYPVEQVTVG